MNPSISFSIGAALIPGLCWFCLIYGCINTRSFRRGAAGGICLIALWAVLAGINSYLSSGLFQFFQQWSVFALVGGFVLMFINRTPKLEDKALSQQQENKYYINVGEAVEGPYSLRELIVLQQRKQITSETLCCIAGSEEWMPFSKI